MMAASQVPKLGTEVKQFSTDYKDYPRFDELQRRQVAAANETVEVVLTRLDEFSTLLAQVPRHQSYDSLSLMLKMLIMIRMIVEGRYSQHQDPGAYAGSTEPRAASRVLLDRYASCTPYDSARYQRLSDERRSQEFVGKVAANVAVAEARVMTAEAAYASIVRSRMFSFVPGLVRTLLQPHSFVAVSPC